ncbi:MAG: hypothetical protein AAFY28_17715 [Actinomycetota bacterium]
MSGALADHDWQIVAPWYRWERAGVDDPARADTARRPTIQKFASTEFVADYLADPQRSVVFDDDDQFQDIVPAEPPVPLGAIGNRLHSISATTSKPSGVRKLFLPAHQRFYMVTVGLHCDTVGFPKVDPDNVAEVGFVIRRHTVDIPDSELTRAATLLRDVSAARAIESTRHALDVAKERSRVLHPFRSRARRRVASAGRATTAAARDLELARRKLRAWSEEVGVERRTQAWVPTGEGSFGAWVPIDDQPSELVERTYPMRHLTAVPTDPEHAALDGTLYYAAIPTASDEITVDGVSRFNERDVYEIVVYARPDCGPCPGPLAWSAPSEAFHLASFYDPTGSAQRPTDIQLPDFSQLAASVAPPSVKMSAPESSSLEFSKFGAFPTPGKGKVREAEEVCFFSIPLITICALFLLNIVLPIVMFVFGLWWMLKLKFCIPPSLGLDVAIATELSIEPGELGLTAELGIDVQVNNVTNLLVVEFGTTPPTADFDPVPPEWQLGPELTGPDGFANQALLELLVDQGLGTGTDGAPVFSDGLVFETRVTRDEVVRPWIS